MLHDQKEGNNSPQPQSQTKAEEAGVPRKEDAPDLSERILDKEEHEKDPETVEQKAQAQKEKLKAESEENTQRLDNQQHSDRILDKEIDEDDEKTTQGT